ncbi:MAG TPA: TonB-dependent receptor plug domain-containing protein, partial [Acetobacteraceae bacterium]|nr:TonB-dependent receptor plug domain-containing protein [Acetobacteraceae bacterium]
MTTHGNRDRAGLTGVRKILLSGAALLGSTVTLMAATPGIAHAAATTASPAPPGQPGVEEVVVTARRREERLQRVPTAVTALGAKQLAERNVVTQSDLQSTVPGLTLRETQGSNSLTYSLRGQTVDNFTGSATAVVPYFDEVQLFTGGANTFFDLQSIQVLKGPQGTLFGRNATGGAVLFTTAKPKDDYDGYLTVRTGDYNMREVLGAVNLPIVQDKAMLRVAFDMVDRDGYQRNLYNGQELGVVDRQSVRASLLLQPSDDLQNTTVVEADHAGGNSTANRLFAVYPCGASNGGFALNCTAAALFSPTTPYGAAVWAAYVAAHPKVNPGGILAYFQQDAPKLPFWDANEASPVFHHEWDYRLVNTTTYDVNPELQLKNIVGVSDADTRDEGSSNGSPYLVFTSENLDTGEYGNHTDQFAYSDEFQAQGKALNDALTYIAGAYYQNSDANILYPQVYFDLSPLAPPSSVDNHVEIFDKTEALYAQATYNFSAIGLERLAFTAGYRYSWEQFTMNQRAESVFGPADQSVDFSNPSWTLGLSYQLTDDLMLYVQGRRSWRSGGLNGTAPPVTVGAA